MYNNLYFYLDRDKDYRKLKVVWTNIVTPGEHPQRVVREGVVGLTDRTGVAPQTL